MAIEIGNKDAFYRYMQDCGLLIPEIDEFVFNEGITFNSNEILNYAKEGFDVVAIYDNIASAKNGLIEELDYIRTKYGRGHFDPVMDVLVALEIYLENSSTFIQDFIAIEDYYILFKCTGRVCKII